MNITSINSQNIKIIEQKINKIVDWAQQNDGQKFNLLKQQVFVPDNFLHQSSGDISEEQSAEFERNNPEIFNFLWSLDEIIEQL